MTSKKIGFLFNKDFVFLFGCNCCCWIQIQIGNLFEIKKNETIMGITLCVDENWNDVAVKVHMMQLRSISFDFVCWLICERGNCFVNC